MIDPKAVAVVGLGAIMPDAPDAHTFWKNVQTGKYSVSEVPVERWDPADYYDPNPSAVDKTYSKIGGWVKQFDFDPLKWGIPIPPKVQAVMDDIQKWAISATRQALLDYGWPNRPLNGLRTAVIFGNALSGENHYRTTVRIHLPEYLRILNNLPDFQNLSEQVQQSILQGMTQGIRQRIPEITEDTMPGELSNVIAGRVANVFNFTGPNFVTDAACASSLAALQAAMDGLISHKFDAAITGGVDRNMGPESFVKFCKIGALSPDGSRPYANGANGFVMGEGAGVMVLKRLVDAESNGDRIYAVVRAVGGSSDGKGKGITAPNPAGQQKAIERAWKEAAIDPATVMMIEGHGTSTRVGDVAEVGSLAAVFGELDIPLGSVALGSVKSNVGHLKAAAGAAGLLKTIFALHDKLLPPSVNFGKPNPAIDFAHLPFYVNTETRPWPEPKNGQARRAGVSSFGFGGTNFHVVLEEYLPGVLTSEKTFYPSAEMARAAAAIPAPAPAVPVAVSAAVPPVTMVASNDEEIKTRILALVSEQTGYPPEMLDLELDLEADLGIDTVKQAELFSAVRTIWGIPRREDLRLSDYNTLAKVVGFVKDSIGAEAVTAQAVPAVSNPTSAAAAPTAVPSAGPYPLPPRGLLFLSAGTTGELRQKLEQAISAAQQGNLPAAMTPSVEELSQPERLAIDFVTAEELVKKGEKTLKGFESETASGWQALTGQGVYRGRATPGKIAFLFPGQGSQYANMLRELRDLSPVVAETFKEADEVMTPLLGRPLTSLIFVGDDPAAVEQAEKALKDTTVTQPAVLTANIAMMRLLGTYGFHPDLAIGHSLGEYAALVAAGVLSFTDALKVVSARGREMSKVSMDDNGCMAAVSAPIDIVEKMLKEIDGYVVIANINSPIQSVIGGASVSVEAAVAAFNAAGFQAVKIPVSHAFHTRIVAPASGPLRNIIAGMEIHPARIPVVANVTGDLYPGGREEILDMLATQVASPVQFIKSMQTLYQEGARILVESGPKRVLAAVAMDNLKDKNDLTILATNHPRKGALPSLNEALCGLYAAGAIPHTSEKHAAASIELHSVATTPEEKPQPLAGRDVRQHHGVAGSVVVSGAGLGLPGRNHPVFDDGNVQRILSGENMIEPLSDETRNLMLEKRVTRLNKSEAGATLEVITDLDRIIKLAGQRGPFDLTREFGIPAERVEATDIATQLAIAAGIEALRDAGIPLVMRYRQTSVGSYLPDRWMLPEALADETGVIFGSAFPGLSRMADEAERFYAHQNLTRQIETLRQIQTLAGSAPDVQAEIGKRLREMESQLEAMDYKFDRRFIFRVLNMGHSQFAEFIGARGPNTAVNAACATTTHAVAVAEDWIRSGRARRVVIVTGDDVTGDNLVEWIGTGLFASGATTTEGNLRMAALPFDKRRNGMIMGMGAAALVLESEDALRERGMRGIAEVLSSQFGNSAFHGTRLDVSHVREVMERVVAQAEQRFGIRREEIAAHTVFVSHETYTPARGGSAAAEIHALRHTFKDRANQVVIANTKGYTGHTMGVGIEDVLAVKSLEKGIVPPIANIEEGFEPDPELGDLNLSKGGEYPVEYALRLGAGFGSQVALTLLRKIPGVGERTDRPTYNRWLSEMAGYDAADLEVTQRTLRVKHTGVPVRAPARSKWQPGEGPTLWADAAGEPAMADTSQVPEQPAVKPQEVVADVSPVTPAASTPQTAPVPVGQPDPLASSDEEIKDKILALVSEQTGYPPEMLDLELDLEADLGIDTVKQAELFSAVRAFWGIPRREDLRLSDYHTLAKVIGFVKDSILSGSRIGETTAPPVAALVPERPAIEPLSQPVKQSPGEGEIKQRLLALVSEKTGYPEDMLDLDLDLEADLGIDTVKQAELFAAVRESYGIPRREDLRLSDYNTLTKVIGFVKESLNQGAEPVGAEGPGAASAIEPEVEAATPAAAAPDVSSLPSPVLETQSPASPPLAARVVSSVPRRVPVPVLRPRLKICKTTGVELSTESRVIIAHDSSKVGETLARKLRGYKVQVLSLRNLEPLAVSAQVAEWAAGGKIQGVYFLPALDIEPALSGMDLQTWQAANKRRVTALFQLMHALPGDAFLVSATRLGGLHSYLPGDVPAPLGGAVSGFSKAYAWEHPRTLVKVVDFNRDASAAIIAGRLFEETFRDPGVVEVGWENEQRFTISLMEQPAAVEGGLQLAKDTVYLVTGGTGGISAPILEDIAQHCGGIFYLTGRSTLPDPSSPDLVSLVSNREGLKQTLARRMNESGQKATPAKIDQQLAALERSAAAIQALKAVQKAGGQAYYQPCDVTDPQSVTALFEQIIKLHGKLDVIIHAAGIDYSKALTSKTTEEFERVFATKADGFFNLIKAISSLPQPPQAVVSFTSVAGRFGNSGQTDYSAANDLLCKLTASLRHKLPHIRFLAIDWGAWAEVGMASRGSLPVIMERAGIEMMAPAEAAPLLRRELQAGSQGEVLLAKQLGILARPRDRDGGLDVELANRALTEGEPIHVMLSRATGLDLFRGIVLEAELDPESEPFLKDHAMNGVPVLPGVMGIEGFSVAATHVASMLGASPNGFRVARLEEVRFLAPFKFYHNQPRRITWHAQVVRQVDGEVAYVTLESNLAGKLRQNEVMQHFSGRVYLEPVPAHEPDAIQVEPPHWNGSYTLDREAVYRLYFHGPAFQVVDAVQRTEGGVLGRLRKDLPPTTANQQAMLATPLLIELCLQTAGVYEVGATGVMALPSEIGEVKLYHTKVNGLPVYAEVCPSYDAENRICFDARVIDADGRLMLELKGYRTSPLPYPVEDRLVKPLKRLLEG